MSWVRAFIPALLLLGACAHARSQTKDTVSTKPDIPNLVQIVPPGDARYRPAPVYVDSLAPYATENGDVLLVKGHFPNGCTQLLKAGHRIEGDTLFLRLRGWQPVDRMCTQALQPFSFIYDRVPPDSLAHIRSFEYE